MRYAALPPELNLARHHSSSALDGHAGQRVTVLGMARGGLATARFLISAGAHVTMSDLRPAGDLEEARAALEGYAAQHAPKNGRRAPVTFALGGHSPTLLEGTDLLCLSGGVPPTIPIVQSAVEQGIPVSNDGQLTLRHCLAPIIGITGSAGKTTATTLVGRMLEASGFTVHVGGNIGTPLLDRLDQIKPGDKVVMELSSFQLELFDRSPAIAGLLNVTPNHLDRHPSMSHYAAAKARILQFQSPGDTCVLGADDAFTGNWLSRGKCQIAEGPGQPAVYFPIRSAPVGFSVESELENGAFLSGDELIWRKPGMPDQTICHVDEVTLRGRHNLANILAAACLAGAAGGDLAGMRAVATSFEGVSHRLEVVRVQDGVTWINDSIATAPERTMAALRSFHEPIVLLAGGRDKNLPWDECAALMHQQARLVVLFGEAAPLIAESLERSRQRTGCSTTATLCTSLEEAVDTAAAMAQSGDVILLSPGCTSFDAYVDFAARGHHYKSLVEALP